MDLTEKTLSSRIVYQGTIVRVREDRALLPNGRTATREVVEHPGGVAVLPLDDQNHVITVDQYRYPFGKVLTEVPRGQTGTGRGSQAVRPAGTGGGDRADPGGAHLSGLPLSITRVLRRGALSVSGAGTQAGRAPSGRGRVSGTAQNPI